MEAVGPHGLDSLLRHGVGCPCRPPTLLWAERCRARGVTVTWVRFGLAGLVLVPVLRLSTVPVL